MGWRMLNWKKLKETEFSLCKGQGFWENPTSAQGPVGLLEMPATVLLEQLLVE